MARPLVLTTDWCILRRLEVGRRRHRRVINLTWCFQQNYNRSGGWRPSDAPFLPSTMSARNLQQKIFGADTVGHSGSDSPPRGENSVSPLTIQIPRPAAPSPNPPPKLSKSSSDHSTSPKTQENQAPKSYRERLRQQLGTQYQGVERYRLDQDAKRNRHWKRWGPYLSDRQWARIHLHCDVQPAYSDARPP